MQTNINHEKIMGVLNTRGPSLPVQIAKEVQRDSLFVSAFLSELIAEKRIKISHLKVGGSHLYYLPGQEEQLEKFYNYMHPKEVEAFLLLKEKKILRDAQQNPAIRVALRSIRDFAVGFKKDEEIFWRYSFVPENEIIFILEGKKPSRPKIEKVLEIKKKEPEKILGQKRIEVKVIEIPKAVEIKEVKETPILEKQIEVKKKQTSETFLEEVKAYLQQKGLELVSLEAHDKKEVIAKIRFNLNPEKVHLLFAYNKKKISDKEIIKAYKKSLKYSLDYLVLFKGEFSKKLKDTIDSHKRLISTDSF